MSVRVGFGMSKQRTGSSESWLRAGCLAVSGPLNLKRTRAKLLSVLRFLVSPWVCGVHQNNRLGQNDELLTESCEGLGVTQSAAKEELPPFANFSVASRPAFWKNRFPAAMMRRVIPSRANHRTVPLTPGRD